MGSNSLYNVYCHDQAVEVLGMGHIRMRTSAGLRHEGLFFIDRVYTMHSIGVRSSGLVILILFLKGACCIPCNDIT